MNSTKKIFIAPLNWGLGHATRCIPIISYLLGQDIEITIGSSGEALSLLKKEFPDIYFVQLPDHQVKYGKIAPAITLAVQSLKFWDVVKREQRFFKEHISTVQYDMVISDNRYGIYSPHIPSILLTHQIYPILPSGFRSFDPIFSFFFRRMLRNFHEIWVPDHKEENISLSGKLSHPPCDLPIKYIGPLSRLNAVAAEAEYDILAILSGPEPQRTLLENELIRQLSGSSFTAKIVQGKTNIPKEVKYMDSLEMISSMNTQELAKEISRCKMVICRSGYSSIMDLEKLQKRGLLIPTPGQTEQEYLAKHLADKQRYIFQEQSEIDIISAFEEMKLRNIIKTSSSQFTSSFEEALAGYI